jgi:hypothetical protein
MASSAQQAGPWTEARFRRFAASGFRKGSQADALVEYLLFSIAFEDRSLELNL